MTKDTMNNFPGTQPLQNEPSGLRKPVHTVSYQVQMWKLKRRFRRNIGLFYAVALFSAFDSFNQFASEFSISFIRLGASHLIDWMTAPAGGVQDTSSVTALVFKLAIAGFYWLIGFLGGRRNKTAIQLGMIVYAADAIVLLGFQNYGAAVVHVILLCMILRGLVQIRQLERIESPHDDFFAHIRR